MDGTEFPLHVRGAGDRRGRDVSVDSPVAQDAESLSAPRLQVGMFILLAFSVGDILFGDRQELWEHGSPR